MSLLRQYIRGVLLKEISKLPREYFSAIDDATMKSKFWQFPNNEDVSTHGTGKTEAAAALEEALVAVFQELGLDIDVSVDSYITDESDYMLHPDHPAYPNRWLIDAQWRVSKASGRNIIELMLMTSADDFDRSDVNPSALVRHVTQSFRHEIVHYTQMKKQSFKKGLYNDSAAFEEMLNDPSQIPDQDDSKYWEVYEPTGQFDEQGEEIIEKEGFKQKLHTQDYLKSHIEIDAHAHDAAEEMLAVYGEDGSMELLSKGFDLSDPKLPNAIQHYYEYLPKDDPAIRKLKSKIYSYIQHFAEGS